LNKVINHKTIKYCPSLHTNASTYTQTYQRAFLQVTIHLTREAWTRTSA